MGRAILIVVILVSTIYAGINVSVQKEMYKLPSVIVNNFLNKECENVSDYALRAAVRLSTENIIMLPGVDTLTVTFNDSIPDPGDINLPDDYAIGNCKIKRIRYKRLGASTFEAKTTIEGTLQGRVVDYTGQIAFNFRTTAVDGPLVLYNDYDSQAHAPDSLLDHSSHPSGIPMTGLITAVGTDFSNVVHYSSDGLDKYFTGGGGTHKCLEFGAAMTNGKDHVGGWVQCPSPASESYQLLLDRLKTYNQFTVAVYAKPQIVKSADRNVTNQGADGAAITIGGNSAALYWAASDPEHSKFNEPGYERPSIGIWYDNYNAVAKTVTMHYQVTINDGTASGTSMQITRAGCPINSNLTQLAWHMYTLTFLNGTLTAYYDSDVVGTVTAPGGYTTIMPNDYGFTLGMKDIRGDTPTPLCPTQVKDPATCYMFFNGLLDQITYWDVCLTPQDVENWFNNYVDKAEKLYIRD